MPFATNLKYIMQKLELTNYKLAKEMGCSQSSIKNWLEGDNKPHNSTRIKLAQHFGITLEELDGDDLPVLPEGAEEDPEKKIKKEPILPDGLTENQRQAILKILSMPVEELDKKMVALNAFLDL